MNSTTPWPGPYLSSTEILERLEQFEQETAKQPTVIDCRAALERLEGDSELLQDLVGFYRLDVPCFIEAIHAGIERGDAPAVARAAHTIRGMVSNFDAHDVIARAKHVEEIAAQGQLAEATAACQELEAALAPVTAVLERLFPPTDGEESQTDSDA